MAYRLRLLITTVKVLAWYDNEINYVSRMNDIVNLIAGDNALNDYLINAQ